jgi:broad specificity phosphatase PhoE
MMRAVVVAAVFAGLVATTTGAPARSAVVLIVRHADKAVAATNDPPLSDAGRVRAAALADMLRDAGVTRVIVDQSQRVQQTAVPLTQRLGLHPELIPIDWGNPAPQVRAIADSVRRPGGVSVVIGHRNTIPAIIHALGGPAIPDIPDSAYDDLYMLVLSPAAAPPVFIHAVQQKTPR